MKRILLLSAFLATGATCLVIPAQAATVTINNNDGPGEGFNDPSPRSPVGGNNGATLGQQRLIALQAAADEWAARLQSNVNIEVDATFSPDTCSPAGATLGFAGPVTVHSNWTPAAGGSAGRPDTWYPQALANALANTDLTAADADIEASFNSSLDNDCMANGVTWYYGLDGNPPAPQLDFLTTAAHELGHGLGFASFTDPSTGVYLGGNALTGGGMPSIYDVFILDLGFDQTWADFGPSPIGNAQRSGSAQSGANVVWDGPASTTVGAPTLTMGTSNDPNDGNTPKIRLYAPSPVEPGSSISHWDTSLVPDAMMEPFENGYAVADRGLGLATCQMQDIGWTLIGGGSCVAGAGAPPSTGGGGAGGGGGTSGGGVSGGGGGGGGGASLVLPLIGVLFALLKLARRRSV